MQHIRVNLTNSVHRFLVLQVDINDLGTCQTESFGISDVELLQSIT
jgi:hypothetical protein